MVDPEFEGHLTHLSTSQHETVSYEKSKDSYFHQNDRLVHKGASRGERVSATQGLNASGYGNSIHKT